jgi:hypothetical protein
MRVTRSGLPAGKLGMTIFTGLAGQEVADCAWQIEKHPAKGTIQHN